MKHNGVFKAFSFVHPASSLYSLIADGNYRQTHLGRWRWKMLISGSSLQRNCNKEGFNAYVKEKYATVRLGIIANQQDDCTSPDSFIGLGAGSKSACSDFSPPRNTAGNLAQCIPDNGDKNIKVMGYILVR